MNHQIGDLVRLIRGHTAMVVLGISSTGQVHARYFNKHNPILPAYYNSPYVHSNYTRSQNGFVAWDGHPIDKQKANNMQMNYVTCHGNTHRHGVYLSRTSNGNIVLEMEDGTIEQFHKDDVRVHIPYTFSVKAVGKNYTCDYTIPRGVTIEKGDMLVSNSGNAYIVTRLDTRSTAPKKEFQGHRLVKESL